MDGRVVGYGLIGLAGASANFTYAGLNTNRELVMWREDRPVVNELAAWFERYWVAPESVDYKAELIEALPCHRLVRLGPGPGAGALSMIVQTTAC
jgi:phosphatidylserine/phosphatidylglycerophosphate/cardiolipin synthase-like enzyme